MIVTKGALLSKVKSLFPLTHIPPLTTSTPPDVPAWELAKLSFPSHIASTTPRLCKSVWYSAREPVGGTLLTLDLWLLRLGSNQRPSD